MNYLKIYKELIKNAKNNISSEYTEKHHVLPKSMGGIDNLVELSLRYHLVAHKLLCKITENTKYHHKMITALHFMMGTKKYNKWITSREYEKIRKIFIVSCKKRNIERYKNIKERIKTGKAAKRAWNKKSQDEMNQFYENCKKYWTLDKREQKRKDIKKWYKISENRKKSVNASKKMWKRPGMRKKIISAQKAGWTYEKKKKQSEKLKVISSSNWIIIKDSTEKIQVFNLKSWSEQNNYSYSLLNWIYYCTKSNKKRKHKKDDILAIYKL